MDSTVKEIREAVRAAIRGVTERYDRGYYLAQARAGGYIDEMWKAMAEQGVLGLGVPESMGGSGGGMVETVAAMEALSQAGIPPLLYVLTGFARQPIIRHGTPDQQERFVRPTASGDLKLCFAITEPNSGTNAFEMESFAERTSDGYILTGQKIFISGADEADHAVVVARTRRRRDIIDRREGLSILVVPMDSHGIRLHELNIDISAPERQYIVFFDGCKIDDANLVGEEGQGFQYLFDALNPERLLVAAWALGVGDYALEKAVRYSRDRAPFGKPIGSYQAVQHPMARAKANLEAARLMLYDAAATYDRGDDAGAGANMSKLLASEAAVEACDVAIQTHGGYAFDNDYDVLALWQMTRLLKIAPLNNEMILNYIGEYILRLPRSY